MLIRSALLGITDSGNGAKGADKTKKFFFLCATQSSALLRAEYNILGHPVLSCVHFYLKSFIV